MPGTAIDEAMARISDEMQHRTPHHRLEVYARLLRRDVVKLQRDKSGDVAVLTCGLVCDLIEAAAVSAWDSRHLFRVSQAVKAAVQRAKSNMLSPATNKRARA